MFRNDLSLKEKIAILDKVQLLPLGTSLRKIAEELCVPKSTMTKLLKDEVILRENFNSTQTSNRKRARKGKCPEVDEALSEWFSLITSRGDPVSGPMLKLKAEELSQKLGNNQFIASNGWLSRWKNRHEIKLKRVHDEKASANASTSNDWKVNRLKIILNDFSPDNIFNADETGLYYRATPDGSLCFKKEVLSDSKKAMDRITVLLCVNMTGSDKRKLLVVGKSLKPRCFKNMSINKIPVHYHANKNAWMTSSIFLNWLCEWDKELQAKSRSILLLIDNCAAHPKNVELKNITLEFLSPNTTSLIQPLNMGIIKNLKMRYRMKLVNFILEKIEEKLFDSSATASQISRKINILQAIQFISESWREISCTTIMNCFAYCGFSNLVVPQSEFIELNEQFLLIQNHKEFENIDENAPCFDNNEDICDVVVENILKKRKLKEGEEEDDYDGDIEPPVTTREAKKCIDLLQKFFMQEGNENSPSDKLEACAHFVNQIHTEQLRQQTITTFCLPSTSK
ncbi:tigger transposable element-derived protein 4-like [Rhopalosiphum maidis]|uniref:tigger transposable element-derived protein 4-like n=1 Tax=Rhopalosiphum maidis TaxID=43146 RepID=UPI000EFE0158|nr:tigger transposable element-derived protein 4-like [Rhopalosiphum maidis]